MGHPHLAHIHQDGVSGGVRELVQTDPITWPRASRQDEAGLTES